MSLPIKTKTLSSSYLSHSFIPLHFRVPPIRNFSKQPTLIPSLILNSKPFKIDQPYFYKLLLNSKRFKNDQPYFYILLLNSKLLKTTYLISMTTTQLKTFQKGPIWMLSILNSQPVFNNFKQIWLFSHQGADKTDD